MNFYQAGSKDRVAVAADLGYGVDLAEAVECSRVEADEHALNLKSE